MGHLGYDKAMTQGGVQIAPRKVTGISQGLVDVAMTVSLGDALQLLLSVAYIFDRDSPRTTPWLV